MLGVNVSVQTNLDAPRAVSQANKRRLEDAMAKGFAVSQQEVPVDRGTLRQSGFAPTWQHGRIRFGYRTDYADDMEFGTSPFLAEFQPLLEWAERQGGGYGLARAVWQKIAEEGITPQPYVRPGRDAAVDYLRTHDFRGYVDAELE